MHQRGVGAAQHYDAIINSVLDFGRSVMILIAIR
jgi:hypothetical protein